LYNIFELLALFYEEYSFLKKNNIMQIGTRLFLENVSFFAVGSNTLLNESVETKKIVRQAFMDGLNKGVIKPFHSHVVTTSSSGNKLFDTMR